MLALELKNLDQLRRMYDPALVEQALIRSINRTSQKARTRVSRDVRSRYVIKARDIGNALKLRRAQRGSTEAILLYTGQRLGLHKFGARERVVKVRAGRGGSRRRQVRVRVHKSDPLTPVVGGKEIAGFMTPQGVIMARLGAGRLPVKRLSGPSVAHMVDNRRLLTGVGDMIETELQREFSHNVDFYLKRRVGAI